MDFRECPSLPQSLSLSLSLSLVSSLEIFYREHRLCAVSIYGTENIIKTLPLFSVFFSLRGLGGTTNLCLLFKLLCFISLVSALSSRPVPSLSIYLSIYLFFVLVLGPWTSEGMLLIVSGAA